MPTRRNSRTKRPAPPGPRASKEESKMRSFTALVAVALTVSAPYAFAGEGNGDPFPFTASPVTATGAAFASETGSETYPVATGNRSQPSTLASLEPAPGTEALLQTANSLPRSSSGGTGGTARVLVAGTARPGSKATTWRSVRGRAPRAGPTTQYSPGLRKRLAGAKRSRAPARPAACCGCGRSARCHRSPPCRCPANHPAARCRASRAPPSAEPGPSARSRPTGPLR